MNLSEKTYVQVGGSICPVCHVPDIEATKNMEEDGHLAWMPITCLMCGSQWVDVYELTGYNELEERIND